jgi:hypothetical protein
VIDGVHRARKPYTAAYIKAGYQAGELQQSMSWAPPLGAGCGKSFGSFLASQASPSAMFGDAGPFYRLTGHLHERVHCSPNHFILEKPYADQKIHHSHADIDTAKVGRDLQCRESPRVLA